MQSKVLLLLGCMALALLQDTLVCAQEPSQPAKIEPANTIRLRVERNISFTQSGEESITADLCRPDSDELLPIVVMIHGGGWITGDKWNVTDHAREMANAGFVVMSINYRLAPKHPYPAQLEDCRAALTWIEKHADDWKADKERLGVWGYSAGAQLAAMLALQPLDSSVKPRCCVGGGTPCDLTGIPEDSRLLAGVFGKTRGEAPDVYRDASPITFASSNAPPCFWFHGTTDFLVPIENSRTMHRKLTELGASSELYEIPGQGHLITFLDAKARIKAIEFLKKHLAAKPDDANP